MEQQALVLWLAAVVTWAGLLWWLSPPRQRRARADVDASSSSKPVQLPPLPDAALHSVLSCLSAVELAKASATSSAFNNAAASTRLWTRLYDAKLTDRLQNAKALVRERHTRAVHTNRRAIERRRRREKYLQEREVNNVTTMLALPFLLTVSVGCAFPACARTELLLALSAVLAWLHVCCGVWFFRACSHLQLPCCRSQRQQPAVLVRCSLHPLWSGYLRPSRALLCALLGQTLLWCPLLPRGLHLDGLLWSAVVIAFSAGIVGTLGTLRALVMLLVNLFTEFRDFMGSLDWASGWWFFGTRAALTGLLQLAASRFPWRANSFLSDVKSGFGVFGALYAIVELVHWRVAPPDAPYPPWAAALDAWRTFCLFWAWANTPSFYTWNEDSYYHSVVRWSAGMGLATESALFFTRYKSFAMASNYKFVLRATQIMGPLTAATSRQQSRVAARHPLWKLALASPLLCEFVPWFVGYPPMGLFSSREGPAADTPVLQLLRLDSLSLLRFGFHLAILVTVHLPASAAIVERTVAFWWKSTTANEWRDWLRQAPDLARQLRALLRERSFARFRTRAAALLGPALWFPRARYGRTHDDSASDPDPLPRKLWPWLAAEAGLLLLAWWQPGAGAPWPWTATKLSPGTNLGGDLTTFGATLNGTCTDVGSWFG